MNQAERTNKTPDLHEAALLLRIQDLEAQLRAASASLDAARRAFHEALLDAQETAELKHKALETRLSDLMLERNQFEALHEGLKTRVQSLEQDGLQRLFENRRLLSEWDELEGIRQRDLLTLQALEAELGRLGFLNRELEEEKRQMYASLSFRITRPLRALKALFSRWKSP